MLTEDYDSYEAKVQKAQKEQQRQDEINKEANVPGTVHVDDRGA